MCLGLGSSSVCWSGPGHLDGLSDLEEVTFYPEVTLLPPWKSAPTGSWGDGGEWVPRGDSVAFFLTVRRGAFGLRAPGKA